MRGRDRCSCCGFLWPVLAIASSTWPNLANQERAVAKILIVEDEANLRFSIRQTLRRAGHEATEAASVHDAWAATRAAEFDLVLTDMNLSGEDGIDLIRRLREEG